MYIYDNLPIIVLMVFMLLLELGLAFILYSDPYIRPDRRRIIFVIIVLIITLIVQNYVEFLLETGYPHIMLRTIFAVYGYIVRPVLIALFYYLIGNGKKLQPVWVIVGINTVIYLTALFSPLVFEITESNHFRRGPLGYTCHIATGLLLLNFLVMVFIEYRGASWLKFSIPFFNTLLIAGSVLVDMTFLGGANMPITGLTCAVVICSVLYYSWLHLQFVMEHERDLEAEQRIRIMISQIQPHFLYNTISTIRVLCKRDPERAAEVSEKFGQYLRQNLDSLNSDNMIPFTKELEHTMTYTDIEMVRFDNIRVDYDIQASEFNVPALTLQPMVENAIRHGIRIREEGVVLVSTRRSGNYYEIRIRDNGTGFNAAEIDAADRTHIGIRNVRERIEKLAKGTFEIESRIGVGTTVTIRIPANDGKMTEDNRR